VCSTIAGTTPKCSSTEKTNVVDSATPIGSIERELITGRSSPSTTSAKQVTRARVAPPDIVSSDPRSKRSSEVASSPRPRAVTPLR